MSEGGQGPGVKGQGYQQLVAWQRAHELALAVFHAAQALPGAHGWLRTQCCKSAVSVAANIAEGYSRGSFREYIQFLNIARGSLAETEYHLLFMRDAGLLGEEAFVKVDAKRREAASLLLGLIRSLQTKAETTPRGGRRISEERMEYAPTLSDGNTMTLDP